jgi:hypothetical protein
MDEGLLPLSKLLAQTMFFPRMTFFLSKKPVCDDSLYLMTQHNAGITPTTESLYSDDRTPDIVCYALLYTIYEVFNNGVPMIFQVTNKGTESVFAPTFPSTTVPQECELEVNPGLGQWKHMVGFVYIT